VPPQQDLAPDQQPAGAWRLSFRGSRCAAGIDSCCCGLFTRRGYDWSERYPRIVQAARRLPVTRFLIDGEAMVCGHDGVADFALLHPRERDAQQFL
jgi:bifunctional non-homologous end joining protein LigD